MKIDIRYLLPLIGPFVFLGLFRAVWFLAGAEWSDPALAAGASLWMGMPSGALLTFLLVENDVSIGHIRLWRRKEGGE